MFATVINKSEYLLNSRVSIEVSEIYETLSNGDKTKTNSVWHHDGDIYKSFKVLIYLNDVDSSNGPHCFVKTTNRKSNSLEKPN